MHILVYSMGMKATRRKAAVHYAVHSLSRGNLKNLMPRSFSFTAAVPSTIDQFPNIFIKIHIFMNRRQK